MRFMLSVASAVTVQLGGETVRWQYPYLFARLILGKPLSGKVIAKSVKPLLKGAA
jgi:hypothetical protein